MLQQKKFKIFILIITIGIGIVFINKKVNDNTDLISQNDQSQEIFDILLALKSEDSYISIQAHVLVS
jgi:hypothetical protein